MRHELEQQQLQKIAEQVLELAKAAGATAAEVTASVNTGFSVETRLGEVDVIEHNNDRSVSITLYRGQAVARTSSTDMSTAALTQAVNAAMNIARYTQDDPYNGLPEPEQYATNFPDLDCYHPWGITPEEAIEKTIECEKIARAHDRRITTSDGVILSTQQGTDVYATSNGFVGVSQDTHHDISCSLIAEQGGEMQRDYQYTVSCNPRNLDSIKKVALEAAERTVQRLGSRTVPTQKVPVAFRADVARGIIRSFVAAIRGPALYRKSSFLLDCMGEEIFPTWLSLQEHPYLKGTLSSASFDSDGVQTQQKYFVEQGLLTSYALGCYSARKLGMQTTGNANGVFNLTPTTNHADLAALLKTMNTGFLVTEVMGHGANITTGDYSHGASGFWVEQGKIQFPVSEVTIAGNLKDMFKQIVGISNDVDTRGNIRTGSLLIEQMMVAGE
ncbi:MAG: metalloprotease PmbA [Gammaproteobacteria bacterium]|nr:metalloprotease PmbA [Gammaproteobacteria bacterium]